MVIMSDQISNLGVCFVESRSGAAKNGVPTALLACSKISESACLQWKCLESSNLIDHCMFHGLAGHPIDMPIEVSVA